jgi:transcriptional regulator with XRE-family HTH domain
MITPARLRQARELRRLTQTALARQVGVHPSAIAQLETGRIQPSPESVFENSLLHARNTLMAHADHPCACPALLLPSLPCVSAPAPREVQPVAQQRPTEKRPPHAMLAGVCVHLVSM